MKVGVRQQNIRGRKLSGHKNIQTTIIYTHVSNTVISSMEDLNLNMDKNPDKFWGFVGV